MDKLSNPNYIGPGKWDTFMIECAAARTIADQKLVVAFIYRQIDAFRCECRADAIEYMKLHPIEDMIGFKVVDEMVGLLLWMWGFHNYKNNELKKSYSPTWKEVYEYYWLGMDAKNLKPCPAGSNLNPDGSCKDDLSLVQEKIRFIITEQ